MPTATAPIEGSDIGLAEMIESLRQELQTSLEAGKNKTVVFDVDKVELELKIAVSRKAKAEGGVAFWVVKAGANVEAGRDATHTFKLTLSPMDAEKAARLRVGSSTTEKPSRN